MKVLQVSTNDIQGGAHRAAYRLHRALTNRGVDSAMAVIDKSSDDEAVLPLRPFPGLPRPAGNFLFRAARRLEHPVQALSGTLFSSERTAYGSAIQRQLPPADVVNLHWITDMLDYRTSLPALSARGALVWTFHDMNAFTGGCHYTSGCRRFTESCGCCPDIAKRGPDDRSARIFRRKAALLSPLPSSAIHIVCPSRWMARESRSSRLFGRFPTSVIPNGLDADEFAPADRAQARRKLGLDPDAIVLLCVAERLMDARKGLRLLLEAVQQISDIPRLQVCTIGRPDPALGLEGPTWRQMGLMEDNADLVQAYSAADAFVIPSLQDNLPNTVLEAMACATPVVGFDTGGIPDLIEPGRTGYLARPGDSSDLAAQIRHILADAARCREMGAAARQVVLERYTLDHQASAYLELYRNLASRPPTGARTASPA